jgi:type IV pilus biogenesis protein PilP
MLSRRALKVGLGEKIKSKKVALGLGAVIVILVGTFLLKFMTSGGTEATPETGRPAPRAAKKISKPQKRDSEKSPLFEALKEWKDPFREGDPKVAQLQDKINTTQKEIEYLKATLEEKKLKHEIKELEKSIRESAGTTTTQAETGIGYSDTRNGKVQSEKSVLVKAILISDEEQSALLAYRGKTTWVHEGEVFDGWEVKEIKKNSVVLLRAGTSYVFFYDRPEIAKRGEQ